MYALDQEGCELVDGRWGWTENRQNGQTEHLPLPRSPTHRCMVAGSSPYKYRSDRHSRFEGVKGSEEGEF